MATLLYNPQNLCVKLLSGQFHTYEASISGINITLILPNSKFLTRTFSYGLLEWPCGIVDGPASQKNMLSPSLRSKWVMWKYSCVIWSRGKQSVPLDRSNLPRHLNSVLTQVTHSHYETGGNIFFTENRYLPTREDEIVPVHKIKGYRINVDIAPLILNIALGRVHSVKILLDTFSISFHQNAQFWSKLTKKRSHTCIGNWAEHFRGNRHGLGGKFSYWNTRFPFRT